MTLPELRKIAEAATPGPWKACLGSGNNECTAIHFSGDETHPYGLLVCDLIPDYMLEDQYKADLEFKSANMQYLETFNPAQVLKLLDIIETQRRALEYIAQTFDRGQIPEVELLSELSNERLFDIDKARAALAESDKLMGDM